MFWASRARAGSIDSNQKSHPLGELNGGSYLRGTQVLEAVETVDHKGCWVNPDMCLWLRGGRLAHAVAWGASVRLRPLQMLGQTKWMPGQQSGGVPELCLDRWTTRWKFMFIYPARHIFCGLNLFTYVFYQVWAIIWIFTSLPCSLFCLSETPVLLLSV